MSVMKKSLGVVDIIALAFGAMVGYGWLGLGGIGRRLGVLSGYLGRYDGVLYWRSYSNNDRYHLC